jgi:hypothetical protein
MLRAGQNMQTQEDKVPMPKRIAGYFVLTLLAACTTGGVMLNQPPEPDSPQDSVTVRIHRDVADGVILENLIFTINEEPVYQFGDANDFTFVTVPGEYLFGYRQGGKHCSTDVQIDAGGSYVFSLKPGCIIEMEKE